MTWEDLSFDTDFVDRLESLGYEVEFDRQTKLLTLRDESGQYKFKSFIRVKTAYNLVKEDVTLPLYLDRVFGEDDGVEEEI